MWTASRVMHRLRLAAARRGPRPHTPGVNASTHEISRQLAEGGGVIARRHHLELCSGLDWMVRQNLLAALLPGVYTAPKRAEELEVRARAIQLWEPDAVLTNRAAARLTFWPALDVPRIEAGVPDRRVERPWLQLRRRRIPPELILERNGFRCTSPALTALDLCTTLGGNAIDTVLRTRAATLAQLHEALELTSGRRGNLDRRELVLDSRDEPWSEAERDAHRLLREAGIAGWRANYPFELLTGVYWIDIAFPEIKLAIEIDGRQFHEGKEVFESDRWRQNDLVLAGWRVLRFTATMVRAHPQIVLRLIEQALAA